MFPQITHLNDLLPFIEGNQQFRVQEQPNGTTVVCYMLQDEDTFRGEHDAFYKECRGITFHEDGTVASRTLHKFQNVGENDQTRPDQIPWDDIVRVMDKRDGSMITFVLLKDGSIAGKTKKTFTSNEAIAATEFLYQDPQRVLWVTDMLRRGCTPTFEWTSPRFPIVLMYEKDELTLLHIRDNVSGKYVMNFEQNLPFPTVENILHQVEPKLLLDWALVSEGIEGWIIQSSDGQMWKIKTKWYCDLHHAVTFTRWRDVARAVCADKADDLKGAFAMVGRSIEPILIVERKIKAKIQAAQDEVNGLASVGREAGLTVKDMALKWKDHDLFGLIMRAFRGQEIDYMEFYEKNYLENDWGLEVVA